MILLSIVATVLFPVITVVLSVISIFAALLDRSGNAYLWVARVWSKSALLLFGVRVRVKGTEHIKKGQNYVYAANHSSYMDIPILLGMVPDNLRLTLRSSLTRIPIWGWALLVSPFLVLDRTNPHRAERTIQKAIERIRNGASVLFFPEGTRTPDGAMHAFKRGAFRLAREANVPVLPIAVIGSYQILPRDKWLPRWGCRAEIRIGEAVNPISVPNEPGTNRLEDIRLMTEAEKRVRAMLE